MTETDLTLLPKSKKEAIALGEKFYFTGNACKRGHITKRYASCAQCFDCVSMHRKKWRADNPEKESETRIKSLRKWAAANPERKKELAKKYNSDPENSKKNVERARKWKKNNPERALDLSNASSHKRRTKIKNSGNNFKAEDVTNLLKLQKSKCANCGASIAKRENRHVDHVVPVSKGGANGKENIQLLCRKCNLTKADKDPFDFALECGRLV